MSRLTPRADEYVCVSLMAAATSSYRDSAQNPYFSEW
jgi:hypothetical protein